MLEGDALADWLRARAGKLTASRMRDAMEFLKSGASGAKRTALMHELVAERLTGSSARHYVSDAMLHGLQTEDEAKAAYEAESATFIAPAGFYDHPSIDLCGATPDGLIGDDGLIEVKCPQTATFIGWYLAGVVPPEHVPQMTLQIACTGRRWCEFVAFDPRIRDERRRMFVRRFEPDAAAIAAVEDHARRFLAEVDALAQRFAEAA
jgi:hypothetical protein